MLTAEPQRKGFAVKAVHRRFRIVGAGPTGALLALGLARQGFSVVLHDRLSAELLLNRSRAYAITHSSRRLLQDLDLWAALLDQMQPFRALRLDDCSAQRTAWFHVDDLRAGNRSSEAIGWILDHRPLMSLLLERLQRSEHVVLQLGDASLVEDVLAKASTSEWIVAADGPRSMLRRWAEVPFWSHAYQQGCLTAKLRLTGTDQQCAYELFRPEGPMAVLPLGQDRYQVVWSAPLSRCRDRAGSLPSELLLALDAILPDGVNAVELLDDPGAFPLELSLAPRLHRGSLLLVGEAGHRCHPVGGQGLNLCWRDVSELLNLTGAMRRGTLNPRSLARRYSRHRRFDLLAVLLSTDLLIRFFSNHNQLLKPFRHLALILLKRISWIRRLSLSAMTDGPGTMLQSLPK